MALGNLNGTAPTENTYDADIKGIEHPPTETAVYGYDTERQDVPGRKMNRIGAPIVSGTATDSDSDSAMSVNKQVELESANSIKYRTCSWQKVRLKYYSLRF